MKKVIIPIFAAALVFAWAHTGHATVYNFVDTWGGSIYDANKKYDGDDDKLCWAATISNMLTWTNWSTPVASNDTDTIFSYYKSNWTNDGGSAYYGADWWFDGTNNKQGVSDWAQDDAVGGGGFFPSLNIDDYYSYSTYYKNNQNQAMSQLATYMDDGLSVSLGLGGSGAHAVTAWGYEIIGGLFTAILITDSDDNYDGGKWYDLNLLGSGYWELTGYNGAGESWYITEVHGLAANPTPIPGAAWLLGSGLLGLIGLRRKLS